MTRRSFEFDSGLTLAQLDAIMRTIKVPSVAGYDDPPVEMVAHGPDCCWECHHGHATHHPGVDCGCES